VSKLLSSAAVENFGNGKVSSFSTWTGGGQLMLMMAIVAIVRAH